MVKVNAAKAKAKAAAAKAAAAKKAAAKTAADAAQTDAAAVQTAATEGEQPEAQPQRKLARYTGPELRSQCTHYFSRIVEGKVEKATSEEIEQAKLALATMKKLDETGKLDFAKAFYSNKCSKNFGFVKDYSERVIASKTVTEKIEENYMTRTSVGNCFMSSCRAHLRKLLDIST